MEGKRSTVLWKLQPKKGQLAADDHISEVLDESSEEDKSDETEVAHNSSLSTRHCLPFKVLGTGHSPDRRKALDESYEHIYAHNRPLFAKFKK